MLLSIVGFQNIQHNQNILVKYGQIGGISEENVGWALEIW